MVDIGKADWLYWKSTEALKKSQLKNGGISASPKGTRYPYIYPRDHAMITLALIEAGMIKEAEKAVLFLAKAKTRKGIFPQRLLPSGKDASYAPTQMDATSLSIIAIAKYYKKTKDKKFLRKAWKQIKKSGDFVVSKIDSEKRLVFTPNSIFEFPPLEEGFEIWANSACFLALKETAFLAKELGKKAKKYEKESLRIKKSVLRYLWVPSKKSFAKNLRIGAGASIVKHADPCGYAVAEFEMLPEKDKRIISTVKRIEKELWHSKLGGICRYPKIVGRNPAGHGSWAIFTCMIARHFINTGKRKKAEKYIQWILKNSENGMIPEHVASKADFEEYVMDYSRAGFLDRDLKVMVKNAKKQKRLKK